MDRAQQWRVTCHTDYVGPGSTYVVIKGYNFDGAQFILSAVALGARKIVIDSRVNLASGEMSALKRNHVTLLFVDNTRQALAQLSAAAYDYPAQKLKIIGITGTKGKTTTACVAFYMLRAAGYSVALISTVYNRINDELFAPSLTTPQPDYLHMFFDTCVARGVTHVVMEVAAQAMTLYRVDGISFDAVLFTNMDHEHGEFYATFDDYFNAKVALLSRVKQNGTIILNADDVRVAALHKWYNNVQLYSMQNSAVEWFGSCTDIQDGLMVQLQYKNKLMQLMSSHLFGNFNGSNIIAATALVAACGVTLEDAARGCAQLPPIPGRLEQYNTKKGVLYIIDYAHTPASYSHLLALLRSRTEQLIVLFGAGGARDKAKRPLMGLIAAQYADHIFLTADNPRNENPAAIVADILSQMDDVQKNKVTIELNREKAIKKTYQFAKKGGIIALLGKGPDEYQIIGTEKIPFSEKAIIKQLDN